MGSWVNGTLTWPIEQSHNVVNNFVNWWYKDGWDVSDDVCRIIKDCFVHSEGIIDWRTSSFTLQGNELRYEGYKWEDSEVFEDIATRISKTSPDIVFTLSYFSVELHPFDYNFSIHNGHVIDRWEEYHFADMYDLLGCNIFAKIRKDTVQYFGYDGKEWRENDVFARNDIAPHKEELEADIMNVQKDSFFSY